jgi:hypothetical protein
MCQEDGPFLPLVSDSFLGMNIVFPMPRSRQRLLCVQGVNLWLMICAYRAGGVVCETNFKFFVQFVFYSTVFLAFVTIVMAIYLAEEVEVSRHPTSIRPSFRCFVDNLVNFLMCATSQEYAGFVAGRLCCIPLIVRPLPVFTPVDRV